jgi:catechol 2,3-dioxygenase-like lactoylglutathione lyase family enzyme
MPTRFDHAVIAVRDLDTALFAFQRLGFDARPGGKHDSGGTHNGLIRFGLDYFELLSVYDEAAARAGGRATILDSLNGREAGLIGYALATDDIDRDAARFIGDGAESYQPRAMQRTRPDGYTLTWRVYSPGENSWNRPWPFLIQWDTPDSERLQIDVPGQHANGAIAWTRVAVAVNDLSSAVDIYHNQLGLKLIKEDACSIQVAQRVTLGLGESTIDLLTPNGEGSVQRTLENAGQGPFALYFKSRDLFQTRAFFEDQEIAFTYDSKGDGKITLDEKETLGVRIFFVG